MGQLLGLMWLPLVLMWLPLGLMWLPLGRAKRATRFPPGRPLQGSRWPGGWRR